MIGVAANDFNRSGVQRAATHDSIKECLLQSLYRTGTDVLGCKCAVRTRLLLPSG